MASLLVPGNNAPWQEVRDTLNRSVGGWSNSFGWGTRGSESRGVARYPYERVRASPERRQKVAGRAPRRFSYDAVYGELGLLRLERLPLAAASCAFRRSHAESRTPEIVTSGSMAGDGKRGDGDSPQLPRPSSTLTDRRCQPAS